MKAVGLITEYNPFHNGHVYHIEQARRVSGAEVVVAVMSGNYVQRGVPAIVDKWARAEAALHGGVDLVFELPFAFAVQPAHLFAKGAVQLLLDAGVSDIVFGAEHAELDFIAIATEARISLQNHESFSNYSQTYATAYNDVVEQTAGFRIDSPNDLLGLAYANAVIELDAVEKIGLGPIQRVKTGYHDVEVNDDQIASATAMRQLMHEGDFEKLAHFTNSWMAKSLANGPQVVDWPDAWFSALKAKVLTTPIAQLETIYQLSDGLANRLKETIERHTAANWDEFMAEFKTKRYTYSRLQRSLLYTLLNVSTKEMGIALNQPFLRILGATSIGRAYLKQQRDSFTLPVIHRADKESLNGVLKLDYRAGKLYQAFSHPEYRQLTQDTGRRVFFVERD
jgi:predicted nucleotidyltransferase